MQKFKLSDQALGAVMMALQNSLLTQTDIVPVLKGFELITNENDELIVSNPPTFRVPVPEDDDMSEFVAE